MPLLKPSDSGEYVELHSPTAMPLSSAFLWNKKMMIQVNCRGYASAQFMQPEPAKYAYAPNLEAKTFMQPEQPYYAHHPGRFFYIKDEDSGDIFSVPYEPSRKPADSFCFSAGKSDIRWQVRALQLQIEMRLSLPVDDVVELWQFTIKNISSRKRNISVYTYFPIGYMSWMNQGGAYETDVGGIVASCVTPYQKVADYFKQKDFKDLTYFLHDKNPDAWEVRQSLFEGEGGLQHPDALQSPTLSNSDAIYETPAGVFQYRLTLDPDGEWDNKFVFGPAFDRAEVMQLRQKYLGSAEGFSHAYNEYKNYIEGHLQQLQISTPDPELDNFVNHWLARQVFYHGDVNRLSTDPQTRNYLQDTMGLAYIDPARAKSAFATALSQQKSDGAMPDGILLTDGGELKYINQVPHTDHCVWLPICLQAYLDETDDYDFLAEPLPFADDKTAASVYDHMQRAMHWLLGNCDQRGLAYIAQGDWCDPMNMVGYKGKGVSAWLTLAMAYALRTWAQLCENWGQKADADEFRKRADKVSADANRHFWQGSWYARGLTDDDVLFGVESDSEGRIFLNPQAWALLSESADAEQKKKLIAAVEKQLETPYGVMMLAPAYTKMRDDVGRVTQKFPGSAENGSVYNHAAAFYVYSLYQHGESDRAFRLLRQMLPGPDAADYLQRGQLPVFIPNYYRGAYYQYPRTAGRSSQLFNTGTVHWVYRCLIDGLLGLRGDRKGLRIDPQLPEGWNEIKIKRHFRGSHFTIVVRRSRVDAPRLTIDGVEQSQLRCDGPFENREYQLELLLPQDR